MAAGLEQLLITNGLTALASVAASVTLLRGKRMETAGDVRVAEVEAEPTFAGKLLEALGHIDQLQGLLSEERGKVALLRYQLAAVTAERENLAGEVEQLRTALEQSTARLDDLNAQLTFIASVVRDLALPGVVPPAGP